MAIFLNAVRLSQILTFVPFGAVSNPNSQMHHETFNKRKKEFKPKGGFLLQTTILALDPV